MANPGVWMTAVGLPRHGLKLTDNNPVFAPGYSYSGVEKEFLVQQVTRWWEAGLIRRSKSKWGSPLVVAMKAKEFCNLPNLQDYAGLDLFKVFRAAPNYIPVNAVKVPASYLYLSRGRLLVRYAVTSNSSWILTPAT